MSVVAVGVDGGGTRTRAVALDEDGRELGRADGEAALIDPLRPEAAADAVERTIRSAVASAGNGLPAAALWAGLAGAGSERARSAVEDVLRGRNLARATVVGTDLEAAFRDAFPEGPGILLIAGTGSVATGRGDGGEEMRVGGWGALLGDEGSGYRIGLEGLRAAMRMADGRAHPTGLLPALIEASGCPSVADLPVWVAEASKGQVAALVRIVVEAADAGDAAAGHILGEAVEALADHATALRESLAPWGGPADVALAGGLLASPEALIRTRVVVELEQRGLRVSDRVVDAARGAANLARDLTRGV
ncbi:MAG TPA: BadF/BadG/BcrA/BcrD ATPase family protein [Longimicrobiales bacterium]|nr:BadF/BadG/BcrA/BcrD ATPase family protein [Longimicrobiales bacterium]